MPQLKDDLSQSHRSAIPCRIVSTARRRGLPWQDKERSSRISRRLMSGAVTAGESHRSQIAVGLCSTTAG